MSLGYVLTVLVEARSGLKFPGPPTFASGLWLGLEGEPAGEPVGCGMWSVAMCGSRFLEPWDLEA